MGKVGEFLENTHANTSISPIWARQVDSVHQVDANAPTFIASADWLLNLIKRGGFHLCISITN